MSVPLHSLCEGPPPAELASDPDISGIGVTVAYTSTAALALLLVVVHYIFVYHPDATSATGREGIMHDQPNKINSIDEYLLCWRLGSKRETRGIERWGEKGLRVKNALTHAMLTMSDFQLITGLSILISGFTQLDEGISAYHWQRLVQLAWFSSVTHLCTLTALRNYFRHNTLGYFWRLPGMVALILMLIAALIPTAHYTWDSSTIAYQEKEGDNVRPKPADHAICYFNHHEGRCSGGQDDAFWAAELCDQVFQASQQRMILSAVFLGVGMCNRLWHLFRLPTRLYNSTRSLCSRFSTKMLSHMATWSMRWSLWASTPFTILVYYPSLATFLTSRLLADMATSRAFEVWWLMLSFCWGTLNLWVRPTLIEEGPNKWTFGQVMAFLVVFAPLITLIEGYVRATTQNVRVNHAADKVNEIDFIHMDSRVPSSLIGLVTKSTSQEADFINPQPSHDYYNDRFSFPVLIYSTLFATTIASGLLLVALRTQDLRPSDIVSPTLDGRFTFFLTPPIPVLIGFLGFCMLLSLVFEIQMPKKRSYRRWCRFLHFLVYTLILILPSFSYMFVYYLAMACGTLYLMMSVPHTVWRYKARSGGATPPHGNPNFTSGEEIGSVSSIGTANESKQRLKVTIKRANTDQGSLRTLE